MVKNKQKFRKSKNLLTKKVALYIRDYISVEKIGGQNLKVVVLGDIFVRKLLNIGIFWAILDKTMVKTKQKFRNSKNLFTKKVAPYIRDYISLEKIGGQN